MQLQYTSIKIHVRAYFNIWWQKRMLVYTTGGDTVVDRIRVFAITSRTRAVWEVDCGGTLAVVNLFRDLFYWRVRRW
jgi:hypothetical protein